MKKWIIVVLCMGMLFPACGKKSANITIVLPQNASVTEKLAAKEIQRYLYMRTGSLVEIIDSYTTPESNHSFIVVGKQDRPVFADLHLALGEQEYLLKTTVLNNRRALLVAGGDNSGLLFGAYRLAEHLGVRFYLHGDVIPDEKIALVLPELNEQRKPLFELRGIHPFHDFPEGPDWWSADDYKAVLAQLPKMGMNFFALHTYPEHPGMGAADIGPEPTVWIGQKKDLNDDGTVAFASQARHFTTHSGTWGYAAKNTSDYHLGASQLFENDVYGLDYMEARTPFPRNSIDRNFLFNDVGDFFGDVFGFAKTLGIKTCVGTETPLIVPQLVQERLRASGKNPDNPAVTRELYESMFAWIQANYPLDYYWLWTPEDWTWSGVSDETVAKTAADLQIAYAALQEQGAPFDLATCGWVLGPPKDRAQFDKTLPKDVAFSAINRELGKEPVDRNFGNIHDRPKWAIPWLEDDPRLISPQLWAGRMRQDAVDALGYGCTGLMGIHWRTHTIEPTLAALASAGWEQSWAAAKPAPTFGEANVIAFATGEASTIPNLEPPYNTVRMGASTYHFKMPNGQYTVKMMFVEPEFKESLRRVFSLRLQGDRPIERFDIYKEAGANSPKEVVFENIRVNDGLLILECQPLVGLPCIAGIEVEGEGLHHKIDCGATESAGDWQAEPAVQTPPSRYMPIADFYLDWARQNFGPAAAAEIAAVFTKMDGALPEPAQWINGPGGIQTINTPWEEIQANYTFVDELAALESKITGAGNRQRFSYWLNAFKFMRAMARVGCTLGELDRAMESIAKAPENKAQQARDIALPIRLRLAAEWTAMTNYLLAYVDTPGDLGTVCNIEQHSLLELNLLQKHDELLQNWLGEGLPANAFLDNMYRGQPRLVIPTKRNTLGIDEDFYLKIVVLSEAPIEPPVLNWKPLGAAEFQQKNAEHEARGVYRVFLSREEINRLDFEYFVAVPAIDGLKFPAIAPEINQSVVVF